MPPLLQAETWSASISLNFQIFVLLPVFSKAQSGQLDVPCFSTSEIIYIYSAIFVFIGGKGEDFPLCSGFIRIKEWTLRLE